MSSSDAQKSEVHDTTADSGQRTPKRAKPKRAVSGPKTPIIPPDKSTRIVRDETDAGGPLVIESDDPELNPPHVGKDPRPTEGTPGLGPPTKD